MGNRYSTPQINEYWEKWSTDKNQETKENLIVSYLPLVEYVADRVSINLPASIQKDDLVSLGHIGLIEALERFDLGRGWKFETFAIWRIKGAIIDGLRKADWVPRGVRKKSKELEEAFHTLQSSQKEPVTDEQMSEYLGISMEAYYQLLQDVQMTTFISIDDSVGEDGNAFRDVIPDEKVILPEMQLDLNESKNILIKALEKLPEKEKIVVSMYYYEDLTLTEIAKVLSVSTSRISQLHTKAILRLRGFLSRQKKQLF
ncbi:RNA polymerase subunit sigma [Desulfuribacillus stibiiarsenatis]|uniref:RNA polymerase sigma factor n=1 Tax=Desulfuribacillus stibiiarsenatis TaxID=1390249 RepID=A0A1E5L6P9_9FIRM|nr:FliA/WhiG family RNA polymerase sigma factor [Desulfuribacillus stibiiarsenatis]OEH85842.1 RNA polymerase subunit sigma [Desulfuribacillus stibiiarsenatis]